MLSWKTENRLEDALPCDQNLTNVPRQVFGASYSRVSPMTFSHEPSLISVSSEMLERLGAHRNESLLGVVSGRALPQRVAPYAMCYGGHQFGHWAGQLGDGRAIVLGEVFDNQGSTMTLQLKGAGPTPYSRGADGRAVLRSSVREYLCSEAMHHLGVPTTRALSLVATNDMVMRDMLYDGRPRLEPGAIVCRVAPSFLRFGSLELPASRGDVTLLRKTMGFILSQHNPHLDAQNGNVYAQWLREVCIKTADLVVEWMRVGFVHGVLNTDNMSVHALTLDYGPYGWLEEFDLSWTPNTTDAQGRRYAYGNQPNIVQWNLSRLGEAMSPLFESVDDVEEAVLAYAERFNTSYRAMMMRKLGFGLDPDDADGQILGMLPKLLTVARFDWTNFFRALARWPLGESLTQARALGHFEPVSYGLNDAGDAKDFLCYWLSLYDERQKRKQRITNDRILEMNRANPEFVLRNYLVQQAIEDAEQGQYQRLEELFLTAKTPYMIREDQSSHYEKMPEWARYKPGCSMLSCSS